VRAVKRLHGLRTKYDPRWRVVLVAAHEAYRIFQSYMHGDSMLFFFASVLDLFVKNFKRKRDQQRAIKAAW
jgi:hypothetical protein